MSSSGSATDHYHYNPLGHLRLDSATWFCIPIPETAAHGTDASDSIADRFKDASIDALWRHTFDNARILNFHRNYTGPAITTPHSGPHPTTALPLTDHQPPLHHDTRRPWRTLPRRRQGAELAQHPAIPATGSRAAGHEAFRSALHSQQRNGKHTPTQGMTRHHPVSETVFAHFGEQTQTRVPNYLRKCSAGQQPQSEWVTEDGR
jgi:hypothetical protein